MAPTRWIPLSMMVALMPGVHACGGSTRAAPPAAAETAPAPEPVLAPAPAPSPPAEACADAPGWRYEGIELPPEFAPTMARGTERLYFAPGMFEPASPTYFSYVFSLAFEAPQTWDVPSVTALLEAYYRGLMTAVAESKQQSVDADAIVARVTPTGAGFNATVDLVDAFTTGAPLVLHMVITTDSGSCARVAASPSAPGGEVWAELDRALACVPCPGS